MILLAVLRAIKDEIRVSIPKCWPNIYSRRLRIRADYSVVNDHNPSYEPGFLTDSNVEVELNKVANTIGLTSTKSTMLRSNTRYDRVSLESCFSALKLFVSDGSASLTSPLLTCPIFVRCCSCPETLVRSRRNAAIIYVPTNVAIATRI
jgi:hypothetical protein